MNERQTAKMTILYERLSRDDLLQGESLSIANQKQILESYATEHGYTPFLHLTDDGYSGTQWNRPGWQELMEMVERGKVGAILVKTMDRMGRDYLRMGLYRERFKSDNIRLIAVSEGFDSFTSEDDFTPFKEIMSEFYARDTSKKIKAVAHAKGNAGKPLSYNCIYGYRKSPEDKNVWLVDDEAAKVVHRIFRMTVDGAGPTQIARQLTEERVERPVSYLKRHRKNSEREVSNPFTWNGNTVADILTKPEYLGHTVNFRTNKPSYKSKKFTFNPKEEWKIFENTHEAIIDQATFDNVQNLRGTKRRVDTLGAPNPLTGLMFCADCGAKMYNSRNAKSHYDERRGDKIYKHKTADFYTCSTSNLARGAFQTVCSGHFIRTEVVRTLVLDAIRRVCGYVRDSEAEFVEKLRETSEIRAEESEKASRRKLTQNERRIAELDKLFKKIYEDNAAGKLNDKRFAQLSEDYDAEQGSLEIANAAIRAELDAFVADGAKAERFIEIVRKYTSFDELTTAMLNEFVSRILVHEADKSTGERVQDVEIEFNFIGRFDLPAVEEMPLTAEEIAAQEKRRVKLARQREANQRFYAKKKAEAAARTKQTAA